MKNLSFLKAGVPLSLSPFNCIALGKNGGSLKKIPFPFGVHALIRNISATLGVQEIHPAELERKKRDYISYFLKTGSNNETNNAVAFV
jgi:hypothetical protein